MQNMRKSIFFLQWVAIEVSWFEFFSPNNISIMLMTHIMRCDVTGDASGAVLHRGAVRNYRRLITDMKMEDYVSTWFDSFQ